MSPAGGKWLLLTATTVTVPDQASGSAAGFAVRVDSTGLAAGAYKAEIRFVPADGTPVTVPVTLTVKSPRNMSMVTLVNAASFSDGNFSVTLGEIVTIGGSGLGPASPLGLSLDSSGKVATSLGGVTVRFNGIPAPLIYVSAAQVNCVVPYEIEGATDVAVQVTYGGDSLKYIPLKVRPSLPGIFTANGSGTGTVAATDSTGAYPGAGNLARAGSTLTFYLTGEGQTSPKGVTGKVTTVDTVSGGPLTPQPLIPPTVRIDGVPATVTFYGEAPGMVSGIMQINVQIPAGISAGNKPLVVSFGGVSTQDGVTVWAQ